MNDPHVESLEYTLETGSMLVFQNPPPVDYEIEDFKLRLEDGCLIVTMKTHLATEEEARRLAEPILRGWELDYAIQHRRREMRFKFQRANVIDRDPTPGARIVAGTGHLTLTGMRMTASVSALRHSYPAPPTGFIASPEVETLWNRYEGYLLGREPLPGMGYFCLSMVQTLYGGRGNAAATLQIDRAVLDNLGKLTSERGDATTARKQEGPLRPLTGAEGEWIRAALLTIIRQVAITAAGKTPHLVTMSDLPKLTAS